MQSFQAPLCKGSSAEGGEGLFFYNPPTAARFPNPSRRRLQVCFAHSQIPSTTSWSPSPYTGRRIQTRLGDACKRASHTCKSLSHKRGLIKIKSRRRRRTASLRFSLLSLLSAQRFVPRRKCVKKFYKKRKNMWKRAEIYDIIVAVIFFPRGVYEENRL